MHPYKKKSFNKLIKGNPNTINVIDVSYLHKNYYYYRNTITMRDHYSKKILDKFSNKKNKEKILKFLKEVFLYVKPLILWSVNGSEISNNLIEEYLSKNNVVPFFLGRYIIRINKESTSRVFNPQ